MSTDKFYFSHDYNARNDRKMRALMMKHGMVGIGAFWCILEMIYEEGGFHPLEYDRISFELRIDADVVRSVIEDFDLFQHDDENFWSESAIERLKIRCDKSAKARKSIEARWAKYREEQEDDTNV